MRKGNNEVWGGCRRSRRGGLIASLCLLASVQWGCLSGTEFRSVAAPAIKTGVSSILDGLVDGLFAVVEPDTADTAAS
jgi:hypothetical protein